jgi:hypothetical protein
MISFVNFVGMASPVNQTVYRWFDTSTQVDVFFEVVFSGASELALPRVLYEDASPGRLASLILLTATILERGIVHVLVVPVLLLPGREGSAPRPGEDVLQVADHARVTFRQFRRDLVAWRQEIFQGFADGRVGRLVGEFPSAIEESGGRGRREAVVFLAGLNVGQPGEISKLGICVGLLERVQFTLQAPGLDVLRKEADQEGNDDRDGLYE